MKERYKAPHGRVIRTIAALLSVGLLSGLLSSDSASAIHKTPNTYAHTSPPIKPCFSKPVPETPSLTDPRHASKRDPLILHKTINGYIEGDPHYGAHTNRRLIGANVQVLTSSGEGSGFLTENTRGQELVITAAHVLEGATGKIDIIDSENNMAVVAGGCYVYQSGNTLMPLTPSETEPQGQVDYAILLPDHHIGSATLKLATTVPTRGSWVEFINAQSSLTGPNSVSSGSSSSPSTYDGEVINNINATNLLGLVALTGIEPGTGTSPGYTLAGDSQNYSLTPGGSGGMVVRGDVVQAISVASTVGHEDYKKGVLDGISYAGLEAAYNVVADKGVRSDEGIFPITANLVPATYISFGIAHGNYDRHMIPGPG